MIKAVIWDMDGVLIDSEPFWQEAEIAVFKTVGIEMTPAESSETIGLRLDAAVQYWYDRRPWLTPPTVDTIIDAILKRVIELVKTRGAAKIGVREALDFLQAKGLRLAIASSSAMVLIETVVERLGIRDDFEVLCSAGFEQYGKPHPGVYLTTAAKMGLAPKECLVIEDSLRGVLAAKAAEMPCLCVPDPSLAGDPRLSIADWVLPSLTDLTAEFWNGLSK